MIIIPYWWNRSIGSVAAVMQLARPDIVMTSSLSKGEPIPLKQPATGNFAHVILRSGYRNLKLMTVVPSNTDLQGWFFYIFTVPLTYPG